MDESTDSRITIDDFKKVELKLGKVLEVSDHPNADRLYVVKVDLGNEEVRQVIAGIKKWYTPEQLVGKTVVVVANLKPAVLRGEESQGMILAATSGEDVIVLTSEKEALPGSSIK